MSGPAPRARSPTSPASASSTTPSSSAATLAGVSDSVLDALARALQLDEAERAHLVDLARTAGPAARRAASRPASGSGPRVQRVLDSMTDMPAFVLQRPPGHPRRQPAGPGPLRAHVRRPGRPANHARFAFLDPPRPRLLARLGPDRRRHRRHDAHRGRPRPLRPALTDLVGELSTRSDDFRTRWAAHDVRLHRTGVKQFHHPVVGDLDLNFENHAI